MPPSRGSLAAFIFGGVSFVSILGLFFHFFFSSHNNVQPRLKDVTPVTNDESSKQSTIAVEDVVDDDEEDDEEEDQDDDADEDKAMQEIFKTQYDDATRLAKKYLAGNQYAKAAAKYKEAIALAEKIPSAAKDLVALYNNSSAMYEKCGQFEEALLDINVVLAIDNKHSKARVRRARVYEAQGKSELAVLDYVISMHYDQSRGEAPAHGAAMDILVKSMAMQEVKKMVAKLREPQAAGTLLRLPNWSVCRNFLEAFPSLHVWKEEYKNLDREPLQAAVTLGQATLSQILQLVRYDVAHERYKDAFETLHLADAVAEQAVFEDAELLGLYHDLCGSERHLLSDFAGAEQQYRRAVELDRDNQQIEPSLKLALLLIDLGLISEAETIFDQLLAKAEGDSFDAKATKAWLLAHRSTLWITRDEGGKFLPDAIEKCVADTDQVLALTVSYEAAASVSATTAAVMRGARLAGLVKIVHVLSHTKPQMGSMITEDDRSLMRSCIAQAKTVNPHHITVKLLEADIISGDGDLAGALLLVDGLIAQADANGHQPDHVPLIVKAHIMTQKAISEINDAGNVALFRSAIQEAEDLYTKAVELESTAHDALVAHAQIKCFMGDMEGGLQLVRRAVPLIRSREEGIDVLQAFFLTKAQAAAVQEVKEHGT